MAPRSDGMVFASGDAQIGARIADYRIEALLGRGGMSVVYLAEDLRLRRRVALKVLSPELASDGRFREQFLRESERAASIDHPNIIPIYEAGEDDGCLFIAMRYVEGTDLKALLRAQGALDAVRSLSVVTQVGDALDAAHEHGLVHRDVKPSNVLLDARGHCYLSDFGLTKTSSERTGESLGVIVGTIDYAAPEQIRSEPVDGRSDVYSLGCLLFECLTGEVPFPHESEVAVIYAQLEEPPPLASERHPGLPAALDEPLARSMAKLPDERYASCRALIDATQTALGLPAVPSAAVQRRRRRWRIAAGTVAIAVAAAAAGGWLLSRPGPVVLPPGTDVLARVDPQTGAIGRTTAVGRGASAVAVAGTTAWVANYGDDSVSRVDTVDGGVRTIAVKGTPIDIAATASTVNVVDGPANDSVVTIDAATDRATQPKLLPSDIFFAPLIAAGEGRFWLAESEQHAVSSADPRGQFALFASTIPIPSDHSSLLTEYVAFAGLAVGEGAVWVAGDYYGRSVWKADPSSGRATAISLPFIPAGVAAGEGAVWVTSVLDDTVARIDPVSNRIVARIKVGRGAAALAVGEGAVWVANALDDTLSKIDPKTNHVTEIPLNLTPADVAAGAGGVWVIGTKL